MLDAVRSGFQRTATVQVPNIWWIRSVLANSCRESIVQESTLSLHSNPKTELGIKYKTLAERITLQKFFARSSADRLPNWVKKTFKLKPISSNLMKKIALYPTWSDLGRSRQIWATELNFPTKNSALNST